MSNFARMEKQLSGSEIEVTKPKPISFKDIKEWYTPTDEVQSTIDALKEGKYILITELYSNGLKILEGIKNHLEETLPSQTFKEQRDQRLVYRTLSNNVLIQITDHLIDVNKAPTSGWFKILYPELSKFLLPFPQVQGLNSAWQWYVNGIVIPLLRNKLHPYYGTYFPTRFDHLELFDKWLKRYEGPKKTAVDVGIGSGVLALQMLKYGFQKVYGTDTNPNAIVGLTKFMGKTKLARKIELEHAALFGNLKKPTELIVFNPPWLPQTEDSDGIDTAVYYNDQMFEDFFSEAKKWLLPDGHLVLLFSNLAELSSLTTDHPIKNEIASGNRFQLHRNLSKKVRAASTKTNRKQMWRATEEVELWVLTHKPG